ncbi:MAG: carboxypeptidase regulatory-like domain-containing protein [Acidobacteria bacterium]|nr:carboxypeptidase regulatory-like domain-containing protein [Acidobacteriota bacterium]
MRSAVLRWLLVVGCLSVALVLPFLAAPLPPAVRETEMRAELSRDGVTILVPITQRSGATPATLTLELLDSTDHKLAEATTRITLKQGENVSRLRLLWPQFAEAKDWQGRYDMLSWTRVQYRLSSAETPHAGALEVSGKRSLALMLNEWFTLRVIAPNDPAQRLPAQVRVFAENPLTGKPVTGVRIEASLTRQDDEEKRMDSVVKRGVTDAAGSVAFALSPPTLPDDESDKEITCELKIIAMRGVLRVEDERDIDFHNRTEAILTTDKPLYQPGQMLHLRTLVYDSFSHLPRPAETVSVEIEDAADQTVFERQLVTDRFGVASADWAIPATAPLGSYHIKVARPDDDEIESANVRVSRYELPTFVVDVEPDKSFYLPEQDAKVKVTARFVYGEPVKAGRVRVAREESRKWDFAKQKWEVKEGAVWEGETDASSAFVAQIPLAEEHASFKDEEYEKYQDVEYVARYTEAASGRSEERRFRLRLTKQAIHLYTFSTDSQQTPDLPLRFYVLANYADGTPVVADLAISATPNKTRPTAEATPVFTLQAHTDRHGIALIETAAKLNSAQDLRLEIQARDTKQATGAISEVLPISDDEVLRVQTERSLYHQNQPLRVAIQASVKKIPRLFVELFAGDRLIRSETVAVQDGRASVEFKPGSDLQGRINIIAYDPEEDTSYIWQAKRFAMLAVLYPVPRTLAIKARFERDAVKPGEAAHAIFTANAPNGAGRETSLGVVVYDTAVEERERTECETGQGRDDFRRFYARLLQWSQGLADVSLATLEQLDESKPFPADLELIAGALLQRLDYRYTFRSYAARIESGEVRSEFENLLDPLKATLDFILTRPSPSTYPRTAESLLALLAKYGVRLEQMTDFWGNPYQAKFAVRGTNYAITLSSNGPDEQANTRDDFDLIAHSRSFFEEHYKQEIAAAIDNFKAHHGRFPGNVAEVIGELNFRRATFLPAKDPWGEPYQLRYEASRQDSFYELRVVSSGRDRQFDKESFGDDLTLFDLKRDWFAETREAIRQALNARFAATQEFPANEAEWLALLKFSKIDFSRLRDAWGQPLRVSFKESSRYGRRTRIEKVAATPNAPAVDKVVSEAVTRRIRTIWIQVATPPSLAMRLAGLKEPVSFPLATYEQVVGEESQDEVLKEKNSSNDAKQGSEANSSTSQRRKVFPTGLAGAITGVVSDPSGAVVLGAIVTLTNSSTGAVLTTTTDDTGNYSFTSLSPGKYALRVDLQGFKSSTIESLEVRLSATTIADVTLDVGVTSETVNITAGSAALFQTDRAEVSSVSSVRKDVVNNLPLPQRPNQVSTPRLRQDFPETLVWQPSLVTDALGRAEIKFNVADSITTWRMAVIGSTADGMIGTATAELRAFQPFFVEHLPPPSLTLGDEIETPVVVRNYQERAADVTVKLAPAAWMQVLGSAEQTLHVAANDSATAPIAFQAITAGDFKQEAAAIGSTDGDRVAKPVAVRFDGRDSWQTRADLFQGETTMVVNVPSDALTDSTRLELKVYPDLFAHAIDGITGIARRPYGCAEQATSAGYTNLMVLQYLKRTGRKLPEVEKIARRNLEEAIARLRSFATASGGYSYFGEANSDMAVTSYILRFYVEAAAFTPVDNALIAGVQRYLAHQQRADGAWEWNGYWQHEKSIEQTNRLTALVAQALAQAQASTAPASPTQTSTAPGASTSAAKQEVDEPQKALAKSLDFLARATRERDDAYTLALYVMAAQQAGRTAAARESAKALLPMAQAEAGALFWDVENVTPFYGWGRAGRLETTGLVVEALMSVSNQPQPATRISAPEELEAAVRRGLLFVVQNKDEYGVWYSTQATVNALRALIAASSAEDLAQTTTQLAVSVDGSAAQTLAIPFAVGAPSVFDLQALFPQAFHAAGKHRVVLRADSSRHVSATIVARSALVWNDKDAKGISDNGGLRLRVSFDKTEIKQGETVTCTVHAERVAAAGYGMMLAEIGLPPGVEVDVESLRRAPVLKYDATPDRVIVYLWPAAGGSDFTFTFRPRLKIKAKAQPSQLYDYYNPDARVAVPPARFVVSQK